MLTEVEIAWLAGLLDGEGCVWFARRKEYRSATGLCEIRASIKLAMACEATVKRAAGMFSIIVGEDLVRCFEEKRREKRRRPLWRTEVYSRRGTYEVLRVVEPYLFTKLTEAKLCLRFLERALPHRRYKTESYDCRLAEAATGLRNGRGGARLEAYELLEQVIPSQAVQGSLFNKEDRTEGVEATTVTHKNNPSQECPAPHLRNRAEGEEMVRSRG